MSDSNAVIEGVSGALGATVSLVATYPLITLSNRQAVSRPDDKDKDDGETEVSQKPSEERKDSKGDILGLYKGLSASLIGTVVSSGTYFYFYALLRRIFQKAPKPGEIPQGLSVVESLVVASLAGSVNVLCTNPIWVVSSRMQTRKASTPNGTFIEELQAVYNEGGIPALWKGTIPSLIMVVNPTIQYMLYEWGSQWWKRSKPKQKTLSSLDVFFVSGLAKLGATLATYPMQVIKFRAQVFKNQGAVKAGSLLHIIKQVWNEEGFLGYFKGLRVKVVQSVVAAALMFVLKERLHALTVKALKR